MDATDAQVIQMVAIGVAAAAMIVLSRAKGMLQKPASRRCAACGRLRDRGRNCPHCS